jgi:hypothetical protein
VVSFLEHLYETEKIRGPFLVVVPLSTIGHWKNEFDNWSIMQCCLYHDVGGGKDMRDVIREFEWYYLLPLLYNHLTNTYHSGGLTSNTKTHYWHTSPPTHTWSM